MVRTSNSGKLGSSPAMIARIDRATNDGSDAVSTTIVIDADDLDNGAIIASDAEPLA